MTDQNDSMSGWVRIALRMTPEQRDLLRRAAETKGMSLSAFVLQSACHAAENLLGDQSHATLTTGVECLPTFTKSARQRWESIPADIRQRLLSNVWCGQCLHETTITNFSGTIKGGDLLLVGTCAECRSDMARVIEGS